MTDEKTYAELKCELDTMLEVLASVSAVANDAARKLGEADQACRDAQADRAVKLSKTHDLYSACLRALET